MAPQQQLLQSETVGRSDRTPFKHWILDSQLGRIVGVLSLRSPKVNAKPCPFHVIDLCAGDGHSDHASECSPAIINRHVQWLASHNLRVQATYIEKAERAFQCLRNNIGDPPHSDFLHQDAREFRFSKTANHQAVFIHADPNHVADMPISKELAESLTDYTTFLMTLGCNVGGIKRLPQEQRNEWFRYVNLMCDRMPDWHDALLISLNRDKSQWAYLLCVPSKWSEETVVRLKKEGDKRWANGVSIGSYRNSFSRFREIEKELFLTRLEREQSNAVA